MDSIVCSAVEEICCQGNTGIPLVSLWSRLSSPPPLSPSVKAHVWRDPLSIPQLQLKAKNTVYGPSDASIQQLEEAQGLDLKIFANEKLRVTSSACTMLSPITRLFPQFNFAFLSGWLLLGFPFPLFGLRSCHDSRTAC